MLAALLLSMRRLFPTVWPERLAEAVVVMPVVLVQVAVAAVSRTRPKAI